LQTARLEPASSFGTDLQRAEPVDGCGSSLVALWSLRGPTTTKDDRKGPKTKGKLKGPLLLFAQVIRGLFRGLISAAHAVPLSPASHCPFGLWSRSWAAAVLRFGPRLSLPAAFRSVRDFVYGTRTSNSKPPSTRVDSVGARPRHSFTRMSTEGTSVRIAVHHRQSPGVQDN
jgi:hypothetical protein